MKTVNLNCLNAALAARCSRSYCGELLGSVDASYGLNAALAARCSRSSEAFTVTAAYDIVSMPLSQQDALGEKTHLDRLGKHQFVSMPLSQQDALGVWGYIIVWAIVGGLNAALAAICSRSLSDDKEYLKKLASQCRSRSNMLSEEIPTLQQG